MSEPDANARWRQSRRAAARTHELLAQRAARADEVKARALIADFVAAALRQDLPAVALRASSYRGRIYRTDRTGWYLRRSQSVAIGTDGGYYVLRVPPAASAWLRGVRLVESAPPLVVGRGGRDGEAIELSELLRRRLDAGPKF